MGSEPVPSCNVTEKLFGILFGTFIYLFIQHSSHINKMCTI